MLEASYEQYENNDYDSIENDNYGNGKFNAFLDDDGPELIYNIDGEVIGGDIEALRALEQEKTGNCLDVDDQSPNENTPTTATDEKTHQEDAAEIAAENAKHPVVINVH